MPVDRIPHTALHARFKWTLQMTEENGYHLLVPIAAKWLASETDDGGDDDDDRWR